jgi:hypothetical protein
VGKARPTACARRPESGGAGADEIPFTSGEISDPRLRTRSAQQDRSHRRRRKRLCYGAQALRSRAYPIPPATQPVAFCRGQRLGAERGVQTGAKFTATTCSIHPARRGVAQPAEAEPVPLVA